MRHEQSRIATAARHIPDIAAAHKRDRGAVGRDARLAERRVNTCVPEFIKAPTMRREAVIARVL
jgi:hypothetical protein